MFKKKKNKAEKEKKNRKPFKDTKAFSIAKKLVPSLVETVADIVPGGQVVKGIIGAIRGTGEKLTGDEEAVLLEYMAECYELEVRDRESARDREIEMLKAGSQNYTQNILAFVGVLGFLAAIGVLFFGPELKGSQEKILLILIGSLSSIAVGIFNYYFGSSKGSKDKSNAMMKNL